jgi:hypothetical protein
MLALLRLLSCGSFCCGRYSVVIIVCLLAKATVRPSRTLLLAANPNITLTYV